MKYKKASKLLSHTKRRMILLKWRILEVKRKPLKFISFIKKKTKALIFKISKTFTPSLDKYLELMDRNTIPNGIIFWKKEIIQIIYKFLASQILKTQKWPGINPIFRKIIKGIKISPKNLSDQHIKIQVKELIPWIIKNLIEFLDFSSLSSNKRK